MRKTMRPYARTVAHEHAVYMYAKYVPIYNINAPSNVSVSRRPTTAALIIIHATSLARYATHFTHVGGSNRSIASHCWLLWALCSVQEKYNTLLTGNRSVARTLRTYVRTCVRADVATHGVSYVEIDASHS